MSPPPAAIANEAQRQAALVEAIARPGPLPPALRVAAPAEARAAVAAWRGHALAVADKALGAVFPTVRRMLGDADFARLAGEFRSVRPPSCGDLGEWGEGLPAWIDTHAGLRAWPWLADTARLDLALHRNERAFDAVPDPSSCALLQTEAPAALRLVLVPGTALVESAWPLATIHAAHPADGAGPEAAFAALREAIETKRGESVMIVREGWRATVHRLDRCGVEWVRSLLEGRTLSGSLDRAGAGFDFPGWLTTAVRRSWLARVAGVPVENGPAGHWKGQQA